MPSLFPCPPPLPSAHTRQVAKPLSDAHRTYQLFPPLSPPLSLFPSHSPSLSLSSLSFPLSLSLFLLLPPFDPNVSPSLRYLNPTPSTLTLNPAVSPSFSYAAFTDEVLNDGTKALELRTRARQLQLQRQRLPNIRRCALIHILTYHILTYRRAHTEREGEGEGERASERASERERKREKEKVPITTHSPHHLPSHTCSHTHIDSRKINASTRACCLPPLYRPAIPASHELDTYACAHTHFLPPPQPPGLKGLPCNQ